MEETLQNLDPKDNREEVEQEFVCRLAITLFLMFIILNKFTKIFIYIYFLYILYCFYILLYFCFRNICIVCIVVYIVIL